MPADKDTDSEGITKHQLSDLLQRYKNENSSLNALLEALPQYLLKSLERELAETAAVDVREILGQIAKKDYNVAWAAMRTQGGVEMLINKFSSIIYRTYISISESESFNNLNIDSSKWKLPEHSDHTSNFRTRSGWKYEVILSTLQQTLGQTLGSSGKHVRLPNIPEVILFTWLEDVDEDKGADPFRQKIWALMTKAARENELIRGYLEDDINRLEAEVAKLKRDNAAKTRAIEVMRDNAKKRAVIDDTEKPSEKLTTFDEILEVDPQHAPMNTTASGQGAAAVLPSNGNMSGQRGGFLTSSGTAVSAHTPAPQTSALISGLRGGLLPSSGTAASAHTQSAPQTSVISGLRGGLSI